MTERYFAVTVIKSTVGQMLVMAEDELDARVKSSSLNQDEFDRFVAWDKTGEITVSDSVEEVVFD